MSEYQSYITTIELLQKSVKLKSDLIESLKEQLVDVKKAALEVCVMALDRQDDIGHYADFWDKINKLIDLAKDFDQ